ncbi:MAG TPA: FecR domain-containing protein [Terriglobales bacterium]
MILKTGLVAAAVAGLIAGLGAQSENSNGGNAVRIVNVSFVAGAVEVNLPDGNGWRPALLDSPVVEGEQIRTLQSGRVEIQFENGSALRLAPNSELAMTALKRNAAGEEITTADVSVGTAFLSLRKEDAKQFRLQLPKGEAIQPDGEVALRVDVASATAPVIAVYDGKPKLESDNQLMTLARSNPPSGTQADEWANWSRERDTRTQEAFRNGVRPGSLSTYNNWYDSSSTLNLPHYMDTTLVKGNDPACPWAVISGPNAGWCWSPARGWFTSAQAATLFTSASGGWNYGGSLCFDMFDLSGGFYGDPLNIGGFGVCGGGFYGLSHWNDGNVLQSGGGGTVITPKVGTSILPPNPRGDHGRGIKFQPVRIAGVSSSRLGIRTNIGEGGFRPVFTSGMGSNMSGRVSSNTGTFTSVHTSGGGGSVGGGSIHTSGSGSVGGGSIHTSGGGSVGVGSVKH